MTPFRLKVGLTTDLLSGISDISGPGAHPDPDISFRLDQQQQQLVGIHPQELTKYVAGSSTILQERSDFDLSFFLLFLSLCLSSFIKIASLHSETIHWHFKSGNNCTKSIMDVMQL